MSETPLALQLRSREMLLALQLRPALVWCYSINLIMSVYSRDEWPATLGEYPRRRTVRKLRDSSHGLRCLLEALRGCLLQGIIELAVEQLDRTKTGLVLVPCDREALAARLFAVKTAANPTCAACACNALIIAAFFVGSPSSAAWRL